MRPPSEGRLIAALAEGSPAARRAALGALFDLHHARVLNVAWRVLGDRHLAEDVVQDVFLRLPLVAKSFRGDSSLSSWLYRMAVNRAIDRRRREARRPAARLGAAAPEFDAAGLPSRPERPEADAHAQGDERAARVQAALLELSPKLRAVAVLRYIEGLSYDQLAEVLDCSLGTIKSRLNRAHAALARSLGELDPGNGMAPGPAQELA